MSHRGRSGDPLNGIRRRPRTDADLLGQRQLDRLRSDVPAALPELVTLDQALARRAADVLAYFDRPGTSNGPTEAINGRRDAAPRPASATSPVA